jgi:hypothetical protein
MQNKELTRVLPHPQKAPREKTGALCFAFRQRD